MENWRLTAISVTKYNPEYRDVNGKYLKNEWTSISDIGKLFYGKEFTREEYLSTERHYINFVIELINELFLEEEIQIENYISTSVESELLKENDQSLLEVWNCLNDNTRISNLEIEYLMKLILREHVSADLILNSPDVNCEIRFGYDYYMYINTTIDISALKKIASQNSLFVC